MPHRRCRHRRRQRRDEQRQGHCFRGLDPRCRGELVAATFKDSIKEPKIIVITRLIYTFLKPAVLVLGGEDLRRPDVLLLAPADLPLAGDNLRRPAILVLASKDLRRPAVLLLALADIPLAGEDLWRPAVILFTAATKLLKSSDGKKELVNIMGFSIPPA